MIRPDGDDAGRIDVVVSHVIMPLDVIEVHRPSDAGRLVEIFQIAEQIRIIDDPPDVALEMPVIDGVEADQRDEQAPISLHPLRAEEIASARESLIALIQPIE